MKLPVVDARILAYGDKCPALNLTVVHNEQIESRRWVSVHVLVVMDGAGRYWETTYELGLTECQDIRPFEDETEVTFHEVVKVPVTTYEYRRKGDAA